MESSLCTPERAAKDAWGKRKGWRGRDGLPIEPSKAFILHALLSGTRNAFLLRSRFYQIGFLFF